MEAKLLFIPKIYVFRFYEDKYIKKSVDRVKDKCFNGFIIIKLKKYEP